MRPGSSRRWLPSGATGRPNAARSINTETYWPTALNPLHEEVSADYTDIIYASSPAEIEERLRAFIRKWPLNARRWPEEAGDRLFTFIRLPCGQWKSTHTTNAIERLHEEFKRRINTQTVLPSAETAAMLFWACSGPIRSPCASGPMGDSHPEARRQTD